MSSTSIILTPTPPPPYSTKIYLTNLGLGYSIAIALGFLICLSSILLASYICCRSSRRRRNLQQHRSSPSSAGDGGIMVPRVRFVAENDDPSGADGEENVLVGLDQSVINSYPKFRYSRDAAASNVEGGFDTTTCCSICLCEYKEAEMLRMMPECRHYFHLSCLDVWLKLNGSCPVCRNSPLPTPVLTPLSTPLAEIVPLSQYASDRRRARR